jgi:hypothetical protein
MSAEESVVVDEANREPDWEAKAKEIGWAPKETFKGDPAKWVDAKTYVQRGEQFVPLLQHAKRELQGRLANVEAENAELRRRVGMADKALEEIRTETRAGSLEDAEARKNGLYDAIAQAREDNDVRKELQLREQLDELNVEIRGLKQPAAKASPPPDENAWQRSPDMQKLLSENEWFGHDQEKSNLALGYMNYLAVNPETKGMSPAQKLEAVGKRINEMFGPGPNPRRSAPSKVEGGRTDSSGGGGGGASYNDLPAAAKEQCDKQAKQFVGKVNGRGETRFPDVNAYRAHYAKTYFAEDWGNRQVNG